MEGIVVKRFRAAVIPGLAALVLPVATEAQTSEAAGEVVIGEVRKALQAAMARLDRASTLLECQSVLQSARTDEVGTQGSFSLLIFTTDGGVLLLHEDGPALEDRRLVFLGDHAFIVFFYPIDLKDACGVRLFHKLFALFVLSFRWDGLVEYLWPDPVLPGDEEVGAEIGSPELSYAHMLIYQDQHRTIADGLCIAAGVHYDLADHIPEIALSVDPGSLTEGAGPRAVTVTATQTGETLPVSTRLPLALSGTATGDDYSVSGELSVTIPAGGAAGSAQLSFTADYDALREAGGETIVVTALHDRGVLGAATIAVEESPFFTEVEATVLGDGVEGLTVEFSRAISGRAPDYAWSGVTDLSGRVSVAIVGADPVSGLYQARARTDDGEIVGKWYSIPLNHGRRQALALPLGGGIRVEAVERLEADKPVAEQEEPLAGGLGPNAPNPFNISTQIPYRLDSPAFVRLVIYNVLGQPVRTLVEESQAPGAYLVHWDGRDRRGSAVAAGLYFARLQYPGGVHTRRMLYLE